MTDGTTHGNTRGDVSPERSSATGTRGEAINPYDLAATREGAWERYCGAHAPLRNDYEAMRKAGQLRIARVEVREIE